MGSVSAPAGASRNDGTLDKLTPEGRTHYSRQPRWRSARLCSARAYAVTDCRLTGRLLRRCLGRVHRAEVLPVEGVAGDAGRLHRKTRLLGAVTVLAGVD